MIGYKATDKNGECRGFKFEVGKTYTKNTPKEELECCTDKVFHFCRELFADESFAKLQLENTELKAQIEKMKCCYNCKHSRTEYEHCKTDKHEKWEMKENDRRRN